MTSYLYASAICPIKLFAFSYLCCFVMWSESSFFFFSFLASRQRRPQQTSNRNKWRPVLWLSSTYVCSLFVKRPGGVMRGYYFGRERAASLLRQRSSSLSLSLSLSHLLSLSLCVCVFTTCFPMIALENVMQVHQVESRVFLGRHGVVLYCF